MARLILHPLPGEKRAGKLAQTVEELYTAGRRLVVWVADEGRRQVLDEYLWSFRKLSFIPHVIWTDQAESPPEPVVLAGERVNPPGADTLVVGDDIPPLEWVESFEEVHDFIPPDEAGEERTRRWREAGLLD
ncbi:MAG: DNA polymerase III subunit chi [Acidobacteria bacterium]|nr:DNA polymerase III subunit chi [Acidobacteriota bacterium]